MNQYVNEILDIINENLDDAAAFLSNKVYSEFVYLYMDSYALFDEIINKYSKESTNLFIGIRDQLPAPIYDIIAIDILERESFDNYLTPKTSIDSVINYIPENSIKELSNLHELKEKKDFRTIIISLLRSYSHVFRASNNADVIETTRQYLARQIEVSVMFTEANTNTIDYNPFLKTDTLFDSYIDTLF